MVGRVPPDPQSGTVARAIRVLRTVAESTGDVSVSMLADDIELPRATVHRLLNLLCAQGMVEARADNRYGVGQELVRIAALVRGGQRLETLAAPMMQQVVDSCGETCLLGVYLPAQRAMTFVDEATSSDPLGYRVEFNAVMPILWGASSRAILAFRPKAEIDQVLQEARPSPATGSAPPSRGLLEIELGEIRSSGYAYSEGHRIRDARGIAAPIRDWTGHAVASLTITIPRIRFDPDTRQHLGALVAEQAGEVSRLLGFKSAELTHYLPRINGVGAG